MARIFEDFEDLLLSMQEEAKAGAYFFVPADPEGRPITGLAFQKSGGTDPHVLWILGPAGAAMSPDPYQVLVMSKDGVRRIACGINHGHEAWEECDVYIASDIMES